VTLPHRIKFKQSNQNMPSHLIIKARREALGMTQEELAEACGVTRGAVQHWERQDGTAPARGKLSQVAKTLGISLAELVTGKLSGIPEPEQASAALSPAALELGRLFDVLTDRVDRAVANTAATEAILRVINSKKS
jgi:transcriptional regulator with XRE-family HTH domain